MSVKIRLRRTGKRNAPAHRIVVADNRSPRDGRFIEILGYYDPRAKKETIDLERAEYWLGQGAQASETVSCIIKRARAGVPMGGKSESKVAKEPPRAEKEESRPDPEPVAEEAEGADTES